MNLNHLQRLREGAERIDETKGCEIFEKDCRIGGAVRGAETFVCLCVVVRE